MAKDYIEELTVDGGFTERQAEALRKIFARQETTLEAAATLNASFGDLSTADVNDTLVADADGVYQVNPVA